MKLRTSFFNVRALGKDITRYSPAWALYSVVLALTFLIIRDDYASYTASNMADAYMALAWFNFFYAPICTLLLFGDVLNSRMCNALHALPMRREGWFLTHTAAGLLFTIVPNGLFCLICTLFIAPHVAVAGMFFAIAMLQFLFFFGAATLAIFCVGNRFAAAVVYGIINFLPVLIYVLLYNHYVPLLYGLTLDPENFLRMCPMYAFSDSRYISFYTSSRGYDGYIAFVEYADWRYLLIAAGVGLVFLVLAVLLYRRRKLECAGDFVAFKPLGPVFLVLYTAAVGTFLYTFGNELLNQYEYLLLAIGLIVGYFTGRMLLDRTVKVFHKRSLLGFAAITSVLVLTMVITSLDPLGLVTKVPQPEEVQSVSISTTSMGYPYRSREHLVKDEATIDKILEVHRYQAENRAAGDSSVTVEIEYTLKDGAKLLRKYPLSARSEQGKVLKEIFSSWSYLFGTEDPESFIPLIENIRLDDGLEHTDPELIKKVVAALYQDSLEGNLVQDWSYHQSDDVRFWVGISYMTAENYHDYLDLTIFVSCKNTAAVLDEYFEANGGLT